MCGFVGFTDKRNQKEKEKILKKMSERIAHRGPDSGGLFADDACGLGFRRLAVLDLSPAGNQPLCSEDKTKFLVFNGEVYNFKELREELEAKGHVFSSQTDAETVLHGFEEYGLGILKKLRGMFAFAIWDANEQTLFAARDMFGIKPLYYAQPAPDKFLFASEIKAFLEYPDFEKKVNTELLRPYFTLQFPPGPATFFEGVFSLPPGAYLVWDGKRPQITTYWEPMYGPYTNQTQEEYADEIDAVVREAVQAYRVSDVPVGSFLSGGVDSSYVAACLLPEKTFSVGFAHQEDPLFNETVYAADLSEQLGLENIAEMLDPAECFAAFSDIQYHMDQPQANPSCVPLWFLSKLAKQHVTVVLSGEGADELFGGYHLYADTPAMIRYKKWVPAFLRRGLGHLAKDLPPFKGRNFLLKSSGRPEDWFIGHADIFSPGEAARLLKPSYSGGQAPLEILQPLYQKLAAAGLDELSVKQLVDLHFWMQWDINVKADRMSAAHGLELRVPLLDANMMAIAAKLPPEFRVKGNKDKNTFRLAASKTLPPAWANRDKKGFPTPIRHWLREEKYYLQVKEYFTADYAALFFDVDAILRLLEDHYAKKAENGRKVWVLFTFLVWYKRFFVEET